MSSFCRVMWKEGTPVFGSVSSLNCFMRMAALATGVELLLLMVWEMSKAKVLAVFGGEVGSSGGGGGE